VRSVRPRGRRALSLLSLDAIASGLELVCGLPHRGRLI
jgi:hypothetical protein